MKFAGFVFFSSLEPLAFFYFLLVLFRFNIKENLLKFTVLSIVLSLVSNSLQTESLQAISPLVQPGLCILFVVFFLRVHFMNAAIMVITGYVVNFMIQVVLLGIFNHFNVLTEITPYTMNAYIVQTISAFLMFLFGLFIYLQKGGFSFIDTGSRLKRQKLFVKENKLFVIFLLISILIIFATNLIFMATDSPPYLLISILLLLSIIVLMSLSIKRDEKIK